MMKKLILAMAILAATATTAIAQSDTDTTVTQDVQPAADSGAVTPAIEPMAPEMVEVDAGALEGESEPKAKEGESEGEDLGVLGKEAIELARAGKWMAALGVFMFFLVALLRKFVFKRFDWFQTKTGGYAMAGGVALLMLVGLVIKTGFSMGAVMAALSAAGLAGTLHTTGKDIVKPSEET